MRRRESPAIPPSINKKQLNQLRTRTEAPPQPRRSARLEHNQPPSLLATTPSAARLVSPATLTKYIWERRFNEDSDSDSDSNSSIRRLREEEEGFEPSIIANIPSSSAEYFPCEIRCANIRCRLPLSMTDDGILYGREYNRLPGYLEMARRIPNTSIYMCSTDCLRKFTWRDKNTGAELGLSLREAIGGDFFSVAYNDRFISRAQFVDIVKEAFHTYHHQHQHQHEQLINLPALPLPLRLVGLELMDIFNANQRKRPSLLRIQQGPKAQWYRWFVDNHLQSALDGLEALPLHREVLVRLLFKDFYSKFDWYCSRAD
jgi:hypothetical protein